MLFRWSETFETAVCFSQSGLASLRPDAWVDTAAIEWCLCLVARRAATSSLRTAVCPPSQFRVHPEERRNPDTPSTAACKGNRFPFGDLDVVLFPVGTDGHWSLAALCHPGVPASYHWTVVSEWGTVGCKPSTIDFLQHCEVDSCYAGSLQQQLVSGMGPAVSPVPYLIHLDSSGSHRQVDYIPDILAWVARVTGAPIAKVSACLPTCTVLPHSSLIWVPPACVVAMPMAALLRSSLRAAMLDGRSSQ